LVVNSALIDFVNNREHLDELVNQILRPHSGIEYYSPAR